MSVIVPFRDDAAQARALVAALSRLRVGLADEILIVDNSPELGDWPPLPGGARVVAARARASSYYARNAGAREARNYWLLFLDADCVPPRGLLDDYFADGVSEEAGIFAGEVIGTAAQGGLMARYLVERRHLRVAPHLAVGPHPSGITANLMVRTRTWHELGGFVEVRSGADVDFCWRAGEEGWTLSYRPGATVSHVHQPGARRSLGRARRYGAGQAWLAARYPAWAFRPRLARELSRAVAGAVVWTLTLRFRRGLNKAIDGLWASAYAWGYRRGTNLP